MEQEAADAFEAPRVASVADERPPCWWIEKGVRTKKTGQSGQGCETGSAIVCYYPTMAVLWSTRAPRAWTECDSTLWSKISATRTSSQGPTSALRFNYLSTHGVGEACAKHPEK